MKEVAAAGAVAGAGAAAARAVATRRGFTINEMLAMMALLSVFILISGLLFTRSTGVMRQAHDGIEIHQTAQAMFHPLREDLWQASRVALTTESTLTLTTSSHASITWSIHSDGVIVRDARLTEDAAVKTHQWQLPSRSLRFEWDGLALTLRDEFHGRSREASFPAGFLLSQKLTQPAATEPEQ